MTRVLTMIAAWALVLASAVPGQAQSPHTSDHEHVAGPVTFASISPETRATLGRLVTQDYQGRMKPVDTLARELIRKITKRFTVDEWDPVLLYLSWSASSEYWWDQPLLYVRHPGVKELVGAETGTTHVSAKSLFGPDGQYILTDAVATALRTPDRERSKLQRRLIAFDERVNLFYLAVQGRSFRVFPVPGDPGGSWLDGDSVLPLVPAAERERYRDAWLGYRSAVYDSDPGQLARAVEKIHGLQREFGAGVMPDGLALSSEILLNRLRPFSRVLWLYGIAAVVLLGAFIWCLARRGGHPYAVRHPLYLLGMAGFWSATIVHVAAFAARWFASGRAPLSNGYESLVFIALSVAVAGVIFEWSDRRGVASGLASLLAFVILGVSMMSHFDPAIGLLVPVLHSYWLNIHVTVITASYGFLGLGALIGGLILILYVVRRPGRPTVQRTIDTLDDMLFNLIVIGLGLLTVGTLLGGVWANESWGRYWGWDPKETWSLVTILAYAIVSHFRLVPALRNPWFLAAGSFVAIASVVMTFFGVNFFLAGLHSYAQGGSTSVPAWVPVGGISMLILVMISYISSKLFSGPADN